MSVIGFWGLIGLRRETRDYVGCVLKVLVIQRPLTLKEWERKWKVL